MSTVGPIQLDIPIALVRAGAKFKKGVLVEGSLQEEEAAA